MMKKIRVQPLNGFGDVVKEFTDATGITKVVETVAKSLGIEDCGCKKRQEALNNLIPFNTEEK